MRSRSLAAALTLAALAVAGCGGGDDEPADTAPAVNTAPAPAAPSKEDLIAEGDSVCAEVNAAIGGIEAGVGAESEELSSQVAALYVGMVEGLKRLGTPEEDEGYAEFMAAADELSRAEGEVELAAERGDSAALATAEASAASALESFRSAAQEYGFEDCGEGPSAPTTSAGAEPSPVEEEGVEEEGVEEAPAEEEAAPEEAPETGGAGSAEEGGGAGPGGGTEGGGGETGGGSSGGIGPG